MQNKVELGADRNTSAVMDRQKASPGFAFSLRFKGWMFNVLLIAYITFIAVFVLNQRHQPLQQLEEYQKIQKAQEALVQADLAAFHLVTVLFSEVTQSDLAMVVGYFSSLRQQYLNLQNWFPEQAETFRMLVESIPPTMDEPSEANLQKIHFHLARNKSQLDRLMSLNRERLANLVEDYRAQNDSIVVTTLSLGIIGLLLLGALISLFIHKLKNDLVALQSRTVEIVDGYRGDPLPVYRNDEVGQLTQGVNYMANALAEREQALEIERSKASFMEKMVAIDSLAGGIAHEIGNPVTCIAGLVEVVKNDEDNRLSEESQQNLELLLGYSGTLVKLTHELSVFDTHKSDEYEWVDVNQLINNICNIFHYDKRWMGIRIAMDLDYSISATFASINQLTQLISNVLENALDAVSDVQSPAVVISTLQQDAEHLFIRVKDNGPGIEQGVIDHIFDPFFSTKPVGQGTGLGLAICWNIVKAHHGSIEANAELSEGTEIRILLPFSQPGEME